MFFRNQKPLRPKKIFRRGTAIFIATALFFADTAVYAGNPSVPPPAASSFVLSPELGTIEESFKASSKTIIYIQDAHDSLEAQTNIAAIIRGAVENHGVKTVFEEGYEGTVPGDDYFGGIEDLEVRERVSYYLMDRLRIGGAEYAHINRTRDFKLIGSDDAELHRENIDWYRRTARLQEAAKRDLDAIHKEIRALALRFFSPELKQWMKLKKRRDEDKLSFADYLQRLKEIAPAVFADDARETFETRRPNLSLLYRSAGGEDIIAIEKDIDPKSLFREIELLENEIAERFLTNERDRQVFRYYKALELMKRLASLEVSAAEYEALKENLPGYMTGELAAFIVRQRGKSFAVSKRWEESIRSAMKFYETAQRRDEAVEKRILKFLHDTEEETAVLVFGGFHHSAIRSFLRKHGLSYHVVTPRITEIKNEHREEYRRLMSAGYGQRFEVTENVRRAARALSDIAVAALSPEHDRRFRAELRRMSDVVSVLKEAGAANEISPWHIAQALKRSEDLARSELRTERPENLEEAERRRIDAETSQAFTGELEEAARKDTSGEAIFVFDLQDGRMRYVIRPREENGRHFFHQYLTGNYRGQGFVISGVYEAYKSGSRSLVLAPRMTGTARWEQLNLKGRFNEVVVPLIRILIAGGIPPETPLLGGMFTDTETQEQFWSLADVLRAADNGRLIEVEWHQKPFWRPVLLIEEHAKDYFPDLARRQNGPALPAFMLRPLDLQKDQAQIQNWAANADQAGEPYYPALYQESVGFFTVEEGVEELQGYFSFEEIYSGFDPVLRNYTYALALPKAEIRPQSELLKGQEQAIALVLIDYLLKYAQDSGIVRAGISFYPKLQPNAPDLTAAAERAGFRAKADGSYEMSPSAAAARYASRDLGSRLNRYYRSEFRAEASRPGGARARIDSFLAEFEAGLRQSLIEAVENDSMASELHEYTLRNMAFWHAGLRRTLREIGLDDSQIGGMLILFNNIAAAFYTYHHELAQEIEENTADDEGRVYRTQVVEALRRAMSDIDFEYLGIPQFLEPIEDYLQEWEGTGQLAYLKDSYLRFMFQTEYAHMNRYMEESDDDFAGYLNRLQTLSWFYEEWAGFTSGQISVFHDDFDKALEKLEQEILARSELRTDAGPAALRSGAGRSAIAAMVADFNLSGRQNDDEEHLGSTRKLMLSGARGLQGNALLLGLGNGNGYPLKELAEQFDEIWVVDVDAEAVEQALKPLPDHLRKKFKMVPKAKRDLTGVYGSFEKRIAAILKKHPNDPERALSVLVEYLKTIRPESPDLKRYQASYVVSSLVFTQLVHNLHEYAARLFENQYGGSYGEKWLLENANYWEAVQILDAEFQEEHIRRLADWVIPEGRIYLAEVKATWEARLHPLDPRVRLEAEIVARPTQPGTLTALESLFQVLEEPDTWLWGYGPHSVYEIKGGIYRLNRSELRASSPENNPGGEVKRIDLGTSRMIWEGQKLWQKIKDGDPSLDSKKKFDRWGAVALGARISLDGITFSQPFRNLVVGNVDLRKIFTKSQYVLPEIKAEEIRKQKDVLYYDLSEDEMEALSAYFLSLPDRHSARVDWPDGLWNYYRPDPDYWKRFYWGADSDGSTTRAGIQRRQHPFIAEKIVRSVEFLARVKGQKAFNILNDGAGDAALLLTVREELKRKFPDSEFHFYGVDMALDEILKYLGKKINEADVVLKTGDSAEPGLLGLENPDNFFDIVFDFGLLNPPITDRKKAERIFEKWADQLKPDGIAISVQTGQSWWQELDPSRKPSVLRPVAYSLPENFLLRREAPKSFIVLQKQGQFPIHAEALFNERSEPRMNSEELLRALGFDGKQGFREASQEKTLGELIAMAGRRFNEKEELAPLAEAKALLKLIEDNHLSASLALEAGDAWWEDPVVLVKVDADQPRFISQAQTVLARITSQHELYDFDTSGQALWAKIRHPGLAAYLDYRSEARSELRTEILEVIQTAEPVPDIDTMIYPEKLLELARGLQRTVPEAWRRLALHQTLAGRLPVIVSGGIMGAVDADAWRQSAGNRFYYTEYDLSQILFLSEMNQRADAVLDLTERKVPVPTLMGHGTVRDIGMVLFPAEALTNFESYQKKKAVLDSLVSQSGYAVDWEGIELPSGTSLRPEPLLAVDLSMDETLENEIDAAIREVLHVKGLEGNELAFREIKRAALAAFYVQKITEVFRSELRTAEPDSGPPKTPDRHVLPYQEIEYEYEANGRIRRVRLDNVDRPGEKIVLENISSAWSKNEFDFIQPGDSAGEAIGVHFEFHDSYAELRNLDVNDPSLRSRGIAKSIALWVLKQAVERYPGQKNPLLLHLVHNPVIFSLAEYLFAPDTIELYYVWDDGWHALTDPNTDIYSWFGPVTIFDPGLHEGKVIEVKKERDGYRATVLPEGIEVSLDGYKMTAKDAASGERFDRLTFQGPWFDLRGVPRAIEEGPKPASARSELRTDADGSAPKKPSGSGRSEPRAIKLTKKQIALARAGHAQIDMQGPVANWEKKLNEIQEKLGADPKELVTLFVSFPRLISYSPDNLKRKWNVLAETGTPAAGRLEALRSIIALNVEALEAIAKEAKARGAKAITANQLRRIYARLDYAFKIDGKRATVAAYQKHLDTQIRLRSLGSEIDLKTLEKQIRETFQSELGKKLPGIMNDVLGLPEPKKKNEKRSELRAENSGEHRSSGAGGEENLWEARGAAERYAKFAENEGYEEANRHLVSISGLKQGGRAIDLGSGTGSGTKLIAEHVGPEGYVYGIDSAEGMAAYAREAVPAHNVDFRVGDAAKLNELIPEPVSAILSFNAVHLLDPQELFREVFNKLRAGDTFSFNSTFYSEAQPAGEGGYYELAKHILTIVDERYDTKAIGRRKKVKFPEITDYLKAAQKSGFRAEDIRTETLTFSLSLESIETFFGIPGLSETLMPAGIPEEERRDVIREAVARLRSEGFTHLRRNWLYFSAVKSEEPEKKSPETRSELRAVSGNGSAAAIDFEEMALPAGVLLDARELVRLEEKESESYFDELLILIESHEAFDLYIEETEEYPVHAIRLAKFQKLLLEHPEKVHALRGRTHLKKKEILIQLSFFGTDYSLQETEKHRERLKKEYGLNELLLLEYEAPGTLSAFLNLAESLTPAALIREVSEAFAVRGPNGRWRLTADYASALWTQIQADYAVQWSV